MEASTTHSSSQAASPGATTSSSSGAYVPRWKRDPNAKPEPYRAPHSGKPSLKPGEYLTYQIGEKLQVPVSHSFLVSGGAVDTPTPGRGNGSAKPEASLETSSLSGAKEELRCILNYPGANPPSTEPGVQVIWTRHNLETVKDSVGRAFPFFTCASQATSRAGDRTRIFKYDGDYRIESASLATKEEVLEFVKARDQSKGEKPASVWLDKLNSKWLKVTLRRSPEEEQGTNPMESR